MYISVFRLHWVGMRRFKWNTLVSISWSVDLEGGMGEGTGEREVGRENDGSVLINLYNVDLYTNIAANNELILTFPTISDQSDGLFGLCCVTV